MSEPRRLWMRVRLVDPANRIAYQGAVAAAGVMAGEIGAHFWVFEVDGGEGRFVSWHCGWLIPWVETCLHPLESTILHYKLVSPICIGSPKAPLCH